MGARAAGADQHDGAPVGPVQQRAADDRRPRVGGSHRGRVLRPGGVMLTTIPFHSGNDASVLRAKLNAEVLNHLLPPMFHGNPVSAEGSLVFTDFGWDVLGHMRMIGFTDVVVEVYADTEHGHLGGGQLVFRITK